MNDELHDHDRGLAFDLSTLMERRRALKLLAVGGLGGLVALAGCGSSNNSSSGSGTTASSGSTTGTSGSSSSSASSSTSSSSSGSSTTATSAASEAVCSEIPEETAGPYPGDGTNGPNVLTESGVVRSDITTSFGSYSGTAEGIPMTIKFTVVDTANGCTAKSGAAVYAWHCDRDGNYSLYSDGVTDQNYLRGVQETDSNGAATFTSIFPACYTGRWPHIHFEVYESLSDATSGRNAIATSQIALPEDTCDEVYNNADGYSSSQRTVSQVSLDSDNVFGDGYDQQLATVSGSLDAGYTVALTVPV